MRPTSSTRPATIAAGDVPPAPREASGARRTPVLPGGLAVLVIDDQAGVRELITRTLENEGIAAIAAASAAGGLERACGPGLGAILLDLTMPQLSGADLLRELRRRGVETPVVLMSGFGEEHARRELGDLEADGFLQKPFRPAELLSAIGAVRR